MVDESKRVMAENRYWGAVRSLNANKGNSEAIATLIELAGSPDVGSCSKWAQRTLEDKLSCNLVTVA